MRPHPLNPRGGPERMPPQDDRPRRVEPVVLVAERTSAPAVEVRVVPGRGEGLRRSRNFDDELASMAAVLGVHPWTGGDQMHDGSDPAVEAVLAEVVLRLRASWRGGPALLWDDLHPLRKVAGSKFEKFVTIAIVEGFVEFSQLLCGLEVLLLKRRELGVVSEEAVLSLEDRIVQRRRSPASCHYKRFQRSA